VRAILQDTFDKRRSLQGRTPRHKVEPLGTEFVEGRGRTIEGGLNAAE